MKLRIRRRIGIDRSRRFNEARKSSKYTFRDFLNDLYAALKKYGDRPVTITGSSEGYSAALWEGEDDSGDYLTIKFIRGALYLPFLGEDSARYMVKHEDDDDFPPFEDVLESKYAVTLRKFYNKAKSEIPDSALDRQAKIMTDGFFEEGERVPTAIEGFYFEKRPDGALDFNPYISKFQL